MSIYISDLVILMKIFVMLDMGMVPCEGVFFFLFGEGMSVVLLLDIIINALANQSII